MLLGFSPDSVATVVRRAVHDATTWDDYDWQLVHPGPLDPATHLALDQVLAEEVAAGRRKPTLRIWEWDQSAVVIGSFQSVKNEVDAENAAKYGFPVVRRISGGGAMFMEAGAIITYSLYAPSELVQGMSFADSYAFLDDWVLVALRSLGIEATYQPLNDIASPAGKIGGAAQKRLADGAVLHHVTMSYDLDAEKMVQVLRIGAREAQRQGHQVGAEAGRPAAQPDRAAAGGDHRPDDRHLPLAPRVAGRRHHAGGVRASRAAGGREVRHRRVAVPGSVSRLAHLARRRTILGISLAVLLVVAVLVSAVVGQFSVSASEVIGSLLQAIGIPNSWAPDDPTAEAALWVIRFPRIVMAMAVGAALAVAGAVMQAIFGNPLAEPGVVGVSSGAALGAALAIVTGLLAYGEWTIAVLAFAGGLAATLLVYGVSRANGRTEVVTLLLTGIAVNAFAGAGLAFLLFMAGTRQPRADRVLAARLALRVALAGVAARWWSWP